jgi:hypothetical protein
MPSSFSLGAGRPHSLFLEVIRQEGGTTSRGLEVASLGQMECAYVGSFSVCEIVEPVKVWQKVRTLGIGRSSVFLLSIDYFSLCQYP